MKASYSLMMVLAVSLACLVSSVQGSIIIQDDVESADGWVTLGGGFFTAEAGGLLPTAGDTFYTAVSYGGSVRGAAKLFTNTFQLGETYTATFDVGAREENPLSTGMIAGFWIDDDETGDFAIGKRVTIADVTLVNPTPPLGEWVTWTASVTITADLENINGAAVAGQQIGFWIRGSNDGTANPSPSVQFDNLTIIPEPGSVLLFGLGTLAILSWRRVMARG